MHNKAKNIYLVGPMGAGKTTIGRGLAKALNKKFYDSDHVVEERTGADLSWLFDIEGEEGFRRWEELVISELCQIDGIVLSTGGGTVESSKNRQYLHENGLVIYLETSLDQQVLRTSRNPHRRPVLIDTDVRSKVMALNRERVPLYEALADLRFMTDSAKPQVVVRKIVNHLQQAGYINANTSETGKSRI